MKQKDVVLIAVIVFISALFAFGISKVVFKSSAKNDQAEKVDVISADFLSPSKKYFNSTAVNPTRLIEIGGNNNQNPFTGSPQ
ncbi:MAG: hypothetical protein JWM81_736 [Candidatus Saccharibacteria bacterium]|nr:hypothetical protein [Candidatus Saccharibacteria bacterium]